MGILDEKGVGFGRGEPVIKAISYAGFCDGGIRIIPMLLADPANKDPLFVMTMYCEVGVKNCPSATTTEGFVILTDGRKWTFFGMGEITRRGKHKLHYQSPITGMHGRELRLTSRDRTFIRKFLASCVDKLT